MAFLETTAGAVHLADFRARLLAALAELIPSEIITYNEIDPVNPQTPAWVEPVNAIAKPLAEVFDAFRIQHPLINYYVEHRDGRAVRFSDVLPASHLHRLALYAEFFRPLAVEHQIAMVLPAPNPLIIGLALNRSGRNFSDEERTLLDLARPILAQHYLQAQLVDRLRSNATGEEHELALLNRDDWSIEASDRAVDWLAAVAGDPNERAGLVPDSIRPWVTARRHQFANGGLADEPVEIVWPLDDRATLAIRHLFAGRSAARDALLLRRTMPLPSAPLDDFGLTRREAAILVAASDGLTNRELGERFSISERTVEKHFSHIYDKLGVKTRTAAVSIALRRAAA